MVLFKKRILLILISLVLAAVLSFLQYQYFHKMTEGDKKIQVIAAFSDIKTGEKIDSKLGIKLIPQSAYVKDMYLLSEKPSGYAKVDIAEGSYVMKSMVSKDNVPVLKEGMRRVMISVNLASSLAGKIKPGDWVDVGWVPKSDEKGGSGSVIASKVEIFDIVNKSGEDIKKADKNNQYDTDSLLPAAVTLIVTPEQAVAIKEYEAKGSLFLMGY